MYQDAVRVVLEQGKASTSTLQRRLRLGYGRAARILDMMQREGIIGPPDGSRPREVLKRHEQSEHQLSEKLTPGANEIVAGSTEGAAPTNGHRRNHQEMLFTPLDREVLDKLRTADLDQLKPLDALNLLADLKKQIS